MPSGGQKVFKILKFDLHHLLDWNVYFWGHKWIPWPQNHWKTFFVCISTCIVAHFIAKIGFDNASTRGRCFQKCSSKKGDISRTAWPISMSETSNFPENQGESIGKVWGKSKTMHVRVVWNIMEWPLRGSSQTIFE